MTRTGPQPGQNAAQQPSTDSILTNPV